MLSIVAARYFALHFRILRDIASCAKECSVVEPTVVARAKVHLGLIGVPLGQSVWQRIRMQVTPVGGHPRRLTGPLWPSATRLLSRRSDISRISAEPV